MLSFALADLGDLALAWVLFPIVGLLACAGVGLLVQHVSRTRLPGALIVPVGFAGVIALTQTTTLWSVTAELSAPVVVLAALAGAWLARRAGERPRPDGWLLAAALAVFAVHGAPVILTGQATFTGYTVLGDTAVHFAIVDHVMSDARDLDGLGDSSYKAALQGYIGVGYPTGAHTPLGALREIVRLDVAWVYQPYLAFMAALITLSIGGLLRTAISDRRVRAVVAALPPLSALLYGYALMGSIKEIGAVALLVTLCALVAVMADAAGAGWRRIVPLAVVTAGITALISFTAAAWLGPILLVALVVALVTGGGIRRAAVEAGAFVALGSALTLQTLLTLPNFLQHAPATLSAPAEMGNLVQPLELAQAAGIWLVGDFRLGTGDLSGETSMLIGVVLAGLVLGGLWLLREPLRQGGPALLAVVSLLAWWYLTRRGSPWADAKALMFLSPVVLLVAALGAASLRRSRRFAESWVLLAAIAIGVTWSDAYAYQHSSPAPRDRLLELQELAEVIDGRGPTLYPDYEEYGKHFLRTAAPDGLGETFQPRVEFGVFPSGPGPRLGGSYDLDRLRPEYLRLYEWIVLRRGPEASRPPSDYALVRRTEHYTLWRRDRRAADVALHRPLGGSEGAGGVPACRTIRPMAKAAHEGSGALAYVERPRPVVFSPSDSRLMPPAWGFVAREILSIPGPGRLAGHVQVLEPGRYEAWLQGSFGRRVTVRVNEQPVGSVEYQLGGREDFHRIGEIDLQAGEIEVWVEQSGGGLEPGNGSFNRALGPVYFVRAGEEAGIGKVKIAPPERWRDLCGRVLDWVEVVGPAKTGA